MRKLPGKFTILEAIALGFTVQMEEVEVPGERLGDRSETRTTFVGIKDTYGRPKQFIDVFTHHELFGGRL